MKETQLLIEHVELAKCVPTDYQRPTNDKQVADIVTGFDESKLGVLTVSLRDGNYHIVDGLHRSKALKAVGYTHAQCIVLIDLTYEQEAAFFRRQNDNKLRILTYDDFNAGLEEKDERCIKVNEIVKANGFSIARDGGGGGFYKLRAIHTLFAIVDEYGYDILNDALCLIAKTWSGISKASQGECLLGMAEFVSRYGIADFTERMKEKFYIISFEYAEATRGRGASGSRVKFCQILVNNYNKGLGSNSKLRLKWEAAS